MFSRLSALTPLCQVFLVVGTAAIRNSFLDAVGNCSDPSSWAIGYNTKHLAFHKTYDKTPEACCSACADKHGCDYFTLDTSKKESCHLKKGDPNDSLDKKECPTCYTSGIPRDCPANFTKTINSLLSTAVNIVNSEIRNLLPKIGLDPLKGACSSCL